MARRDFCSWDRPCNAARRSAQCAGQGPRFVDHSPAAAGRCPSGHGADHEPQISLEFSEQATKCYRLLVFLWEISNGMGTETQIDDPPESRITDARMMHTRQELMPSIRSAPQPNTTGAFASDPAAMPALVQNLNAMAELALRSAKREEHKTSMISRLSSE